MHAYSNLWHVDYTVSFSLRSGLRGSSASVPTIGPIVACSGGASLSAAAGNTGSSGWTDKSGRYPGVGNTTSSSGATGSTFPRGGHSPHGHYGGHHGHNQDTPASETAHRKRNIGGSKNATPSGGGTWRSLNNPLLSTLTSGTS